MASNTVAALDSALKQYVAGGKLVKLAYKKHPFLALLKKSKKFPGRDIPIVPWFAGTGGQSRDFAIAKANKSAEETVQFRLTRKKDYALSSIDMEALLATEDDEGSFLKLGTDAVDNTSKQVSRNISLSLYRNHGGARGKIGAISGTALTLLNPGDVVNFEKNMKIRHGQTDGTSGALEAEAALTITGINRYTGVLYSANWTGFDVGNFLFREGDFGAAMNGVAAWVPTTAPTPGGGDSYLGDDRSVDSRLYGQYIDAVTLGLNPIEALEYADAITVREGGSPDVALCNPIDLRIIKTMLGSQIEYDMVSSPDVTSISFKALVLPSTGSGGAIKLIGDPDCPQGEVSMLELDTWELKTLGDAPRGLEANGFKFITEEATDSVEIRVGMYGNLACWAPSYNCRIKIA